WHADARMKLPSNPDARAGLGAALMLLAFLTAVELADGPQANHIGLFAAAPFLVAAFASWREVLAVGGVATLLGVLFALPAQAGRPAALMINIGGIVVSTGIAAAVGVIRQRQADQVAELSKLASVAQQAVLRPIGGQ